MALNFLPQVPSELKPRITVIGVGGAGGNAVNNMIQSRLEGVEFICANTDAQALSLVQTENRVQLGLTTTQGLGAGSRPDVGRVAAEESLEELTAMLEGTNMVFITAGMGGGTGTGAAPVIAKAARDRNILTVGVVTKPFHFEGPHRMRTAEAGIETLSQIVDTLIIIPNQNLFRIATERTTFAEAFKMADDVLHSGVRGVTDLMVMPGLINLDFADIRCVMSEMGKAMMGTGEAEGDKRSLKAAEAAISNPLLDDTSMKGAKGVLINITGGMDMTLFEADEAANRIREEVDADANIIFGSTFDEKLNGKIRVSVVATGIESESSQKSQPHVVTLPTAAQAQPTLIKPQAPATSPQPNNGPSNGHGNGHNNGSTASFAPAAQSTFRAPPSVGPSTVGPATIGPATIGPATIGNVALAQASHAPQPAPQMMRPAARPVASAQAEPVQTRMTQLEMPAHPREEPQTRHDSDLRINPLFDRPVPESRPVIEPRADHSPAMGGSSARDTDQSMDAMSRAVEGITTHDQHIQNRQPQAPSSQVYSTEEPRRSTSLFDRLLSSRRTTTTQTTHTQAHAQHQPHAPEQARAPEPAPRLSGIEARREPVVSTHADDLNIPAFLRRQAN